MILESSTAFDADGPYYEFTVKVYDHEIKRAYASRYVDSLVVQRLTQQYGKEEGTLANRLHALASLAFLLEKI